MPAFAGMTCWKLFPALALPFLLAGCAYFLGESFTYQDLRDPKTGTTVVCEAHIGRGEATPAELDTMNACIAWYESKGYVKLD